LAQDVPCRIIVSVDDKQTLDYVKKYPVEIVQVKRRERENKAQCPWNRYFNDLLKKATGWVVYLDDDVIMRPDALKTIKPYCTNDKNVIVWKYQFASGRVIPERKYWEHRPQRKHIDTGCFCHHVSQHVHWVTLRASDWRVIRQLWDRKYKDGIRFHWINKVLFEAGNNGTNGNKNDC